MEELMLRINNVSKQYKLGQIGGTTLRDELQRWKAKRSGKEDPTKRIGSKDYVKGETFLALDGVSFDVNKGERIGIIGHNGAGKSTLLKLISRVTAPTSGRIGLNGRVASMLEVGTGFHPELTGRENIYMNGAILGMTKTEIDRKMENIIEFSECRQFIDTPVKRYSSGMYVKLAFSVAAHLDSEIMIMDEVLAVGDAAFQEKCIQKMMSVAEDEQRTILYVSHNMSTIRQLCEKCIVLDHGHLLYEGDVETAIAYYYNRNYSLSRSYDLTNLTRPSGQGRIVRIDHFEFNNKDLPIYDEAENLQFKIKWSAYKDYEGISFRLVICSKAGTPIGIAALNRYTTAEAGKQYVDEFCVDISSLTEGEYLFFVVMYALLSDGQNVVLDGPPINIPFSVEPSVIQGLQIDHKCWGYVRFDHMVAKRLEKSDVNV